MFARLTFLKILPEHFAQVRKTYNEEVVPVIRRQKGAINMMLLEPTDPAGDCISITQWENQKDADQYEASGVYKELVSKVKPFLTKEPVLRTYTVQTTGKDIPVANR